MKMKFPFLLTLFVSTSLLAQEECILRQPCQTLECNKLINYIISAENFVKPVSDEEVDACLEKISRLTIEGKAFKFPMNVWPFSKSLREIVVPFCSEFRRSEGAWSPSLYESIKLKDAIKKISFQSYFELKSDPKKMLRFMKHLGYGLIQKDFFDRSEGAQSVWRNIGSPDFHSKEFRENLSEKDKNIYDRMAVSVASFKKAIIKEYGRQFHGLTIRNWYTGMVSHATIHNILPKEFADFSVKYFRSIPEETREQKEYDLLQAFKALQNCSNPIQEAARLHMEIVNIHPYADGNGRTARLFMNMALASADYPPVVMFSEKSYGDAVWNSWMKKDDSIFEDFLRERVCKTAGAMNKYGEKYGEKLIQKAKNCTNEVQKMVKERYNSLQGYFSPKTLFVESDMVKLLSDIKMQGCQQEVFDLMLQYDNGVVDESEEFSSASQQKANEGDL